MGRARFEAPVGVGYHAARRARDERSRHYTRDDRKASRPSGSSMGSAIAGAVPVGIVNQTHRKTFLPHRKCDWTSHPPRRRPRKRNDRDNRSRRGCATSRLSDAAEPEIYTSRLRSSRLTVVVQTSHELGLATSVIRSAVKSIDPDLPASPQAMTSVVDGTIGLPSLRRPCFPCWQPLL